MAQLGLPFSPHYLQYRVLSVQHFQEAPTIFSLKVKQISRDEKCQIPACSSISLQKPILDPASSSDYCPSPVSSHHHAPRKACASTPTSPSHKGQEDHSVQLPPTLPQRFILISPTPQLQTQQTPLGLNPSPHLPCPHLLPFCVSE